MLLNEVVLEEYRILQVSRSQCCEIIIYRIFDKVGSVFCNIHSLVTLASALL